MWVYWYDEKVKNSIFRLYKKKNYGRKKENNKKDRTSFN